MSEQNILSVLIRCLFPLYSHTIKVEKKKNGPNMVFRGILNITIIIISLFTHFKNTLNSSLNINHFFYNIYTVIQLTTSFIPY